MGSLDRERRIAALERKVAEICQHLDEYHGTALLDVIIADPECDHRWLPRQSGPTICTKCGTVMP